MEAHILNPAKIEDYILVESVVQNFGSEELVGSWSLMKLAKVSEDSLELELLEVDNLAAVEVAAAAVPGWPVEVLVDNPMADLMVDNLGIV